VLNIITKYESGEPFVDSKNGGRKKIGTDSFELYFLKEELSRQIYRYHEKGDFTVNDLHFYAKNEL
jgi:hypothetical protein